LFYASCTGIVQEPVISAAIAEIQRQFLQYRVIALSDERLLILRSPST